MKKIIIAILLSAFCATMWGQSKKDIKTYETAVILMNEGKYKEALPLLKGLVTSNKEFVDASWTLAELYSRMCDSEKQIATLANVAKPKMPRYYNSVMRLAGAYHGLCDYTNAIKQYQLIPTSETTYYKRAQAGIKECEDALELKQEPVPFNFRNMGNAINTEFDEYWPSLTANEGYFSLTRKLNKRQGQSDFGRGIHEDIYLSKREDGAWGTAQNVGQSINSIGNEGAQSISLDGRYMFFVACDRQGGMGGCDIYYSIHEGKGWTPAINCGAPVNTRHWETSPSLSPTGDVLYFASTRPNGQGKCDIWACRVEIQQDGRLKFSEPVNLGPTVNTPEDELSPFIHADNHTLYFSSKGRKGMGGHDIFVTYRDEKGKWSTPKNIGYPINTCKDETGFVVNAYGDKAYFSSDGQEKNWKGRDIYELTLAEGNMRPAQKMKYATGKIVDADKKQPMQATIDVYGTTSNRTIFRSVSDKESGEFIACVPSDEEYGVNVSKKGYLFFSDNFGGSSQQGNSTNKSSKKVDLTKDNNVRMERIEVGKKITLKNIFFDFDKATLKKASHFELNRVAQFMRENPTVRIKLCGHTDYKGTKEYNMTLSNDRAKAAYEYLVKKGVPTNRLEYQGFGAEQPIADNKTDAGRALNRRTEILIIGK
ncbi:MAG: OmpA family protein [Paludibacteraceae bacterium]|nr:OmpA family protein [Paludibacteraceae bacterium]MBP5482035.1 OmpA family protein [Paludibacteraceae bacterium]